MKQSVIKQKMLGNKSKVKKRKLKQKFFLPVYIPQVLIKTLKRFLCTLINSDIFSPQRLLLLVRPCQFDKCLFVTEREYPNAI